MSKQKPKQEAPEKETERDEVQSALDAIERLTGDKLNKENGRREEAMEPEKARKQGKNGR